MGEQWSVVRLYVYRLVHFGECLLALVFLSSCLEQLPRCRYDARTAVGGGDLQFGHLLYSVVHARLHIHEAHSEILHTVYHLISGVDHHLLVLELSHLCPHHLQHT